MAMEYVQEMRRGALIFSNVVIVALILKERELSFRLHFPP